MPGEAVERLEQLARCVDGPLVAAHAAHARALVDRDVEAQRDVVDRYEAIDALGLAAEAAAELADLHRAPRRVAPGHGCATAFGRARRAGRRGAHAGAGRGATGSSRSRPANGRSPCSRQPGAAAVTSAITSGCRRGPSIPTSPGCTASWASAVDPSWRRRSTRDLRHYVVGPVQTCADNYVVTPDGGHAGTRS